MSAGAWTIVGVAFFALAMLAAVASAVLALFRQNGRLLVRLEALEGEVREWRAASQNGRTTGGVVLPSAPQPGTRAPDFRLPDLTGAVFELADLRGHKTVLLFWDPGSPFCQVMLDDLKAWEKAQPPGGPRVVVISTGGRDRTTGLGLSSLILLDDSFELTEQFGIPDTPAAVLLDAQNKIASGIALGSDAVFELARHKTPARP